MRWKDVCALARRLPEVEDGTSYGARVLRVRGSFVARLREDRRSILVKVGSDEAAALCAARPETFAREPGGWDDSAVVVGLRSVQPAELWPVLVGSWRRSAPPSLVAASDPSRLAD